jgi:hypothetical protein
VVDQFRDMECMARPLILQYGILIGNANIDTTRTLTKLLECGVIEQTCQSEVDKHWLCERLRTKLSNGWPIVREIKGSSPDEFVLKLHKNIYGQKQAGRVWNQHLVKRLKSIGFIQCHSDECAFFKGNAVYALDTDDGLKNLTKLSKKWEKRR